MSEQHSVPNDLVSLKDAASIASVSLITIKRRIARGLIPTYGSVSTQRVSIRDVIRREPSRRRQVYYTPGDVPPIALYPTRKPPKGV